MPNKSSGKQQAKGESSKGKSRKGKEPQAGPSTGESSTQTEEFESRMVRADLTRAQFFTLTLPVADQESVHHK
jgi:hypothetical protein